jgi:AcrR family transcriptional regulator
VPEGRKVRADAQRNIETLLAAAKDVFMTKGVDAPMREIAAAAGVGVGTVYRHFPQRSDLIVAVFRGEIDACVTAATTFAAEHEPVEALALFLQHYSTFVGTKRGLAAALHSGDPAYDALPGYFEGQVLPQLKALLDAADAAGELRADVEPIDLIRAVANLAQGNDDHAGRMITLIVDGLRYRATR